jgi:quercetin dioxygenase-like cupin family protein
MKILSRQTSSATAGISGVVPTKHPGKNGLERLAGRHWAMQCAAGLILAKSLAGSVHAEDLAIRTVKPGSIALTKQMAGPSSAFVVGGAQRPGLYVITALYPAGVKSKPHVHPDQRVMTVISGTFYAGTGGKFDEKNVQALGPGSMLIIPPNTLHWGWAKDGDVVVEEVGIGPTGTQFPASVPGQ